MSKLYCIFSRTSSGMKKSASEQVRDICNWQLLSCSQNLLKVCSFVCLFVSVATASPLDQGLLIHDVSRSHAMTHNCRGIPLDDWSARRRDLYLTTHNTHSIQASMPPVGSEPTISTGEQSQTYALDRAATGTGLLKVTHVYFLKSRFRSYFIVLILERYLKELSLYTFFQNHIQASYYHYICIYELAVKFHL